MAVWRDISLLWLIFLTLIAILPVGVIFFFAVRGMRRLRQLAKQYLPIAQQKAAQVAELTERASHKVVKPVVEVHARATEVDSMMTAILRRKRA
jgi:hypothetical protein